MKKLIGYPLPLGVLEKNEEVNFSVEVESGASCKLCFFKKGAEFPKVELEMPEEEAIGEVRFLAVPKVTVKNMEYCYRVNGRYTADPYAKQISLGKYGYRSAVSGEAYDWEGDKPLRIPNHEVVAYNIHVKGFTKHPSSKIKKKGTFAGVIEKIPYLQELGINQIQCMPVYAFKENEKYTNYWGYGDAFCFAVKNEYAAGKDAEIELKDMIKACHKAGMEVVLHLPFTNQVSMQYILDVLRYYVVEFHVDGFVLNSYNISLEFLKADSILKGTKLLEYKDDFQNLMRRYLKGDEGLVLEVKEWLSKRADESGSYNYITNHTGFTLADLVSYNEKHNELNGERNADGPVENFSWNCGEEGPSKKKHVLALRKKQMKNALFLTLMAQGTPILLMGDEFANTQYGNNNVYCQDNEISWLNWKDLDKEKELFEYVKKLIELRKEYSILHTEKPLLGKDMIGHGVPDVSYHGTNAWRPDVDKDSRQLGVYYHGEDGTDIFIAYNMHYEKKIMALPSLVEGKTWNVILSTAEDVESAAECQKSILVPERTIVMLVGR